MSRRAGSAGGTCRQFESQIAWRPAPTLPPLLPDRACSSCRWVVGLHFAFQDAENLYLVMDYMAGGDLMGLLIAKDTFPEAATRIFAAQMVMAVGSVHAMGYIHRDVKVSPAPAARAVTRPPKNAPAACCNTSRNCRPARASLRTLTASLQLVLAA